jgi:hypothetical protein
MTRRSTRVTPEASKHTKVVKSEAAEQPADSEAEIANQVRLLGEIRVIRERIAKRVGTFDVVKDLHRSRRALR